MTDATILGASGHLGAALSVSARPGTRLTLGYCSKKLPGGLRFAFAEDGLLPPSATVIGSFPLARQLEGRSESEVREAVRRYIGRCGGARIVQLSTDAVFSGRQGLRSEDDAPDPATAYGTAQARVDAALLDLAPASLVVRTSFIFGWAGERFDKRLRPLIGGLKQPLHQRWAANVYRAPTEVNFLADAIWRAIDRNTRGILNIAGPRLSIFQFFADALRGVGEFTLPPPHEETDAAVARDTSLCTARSETELGIDSGESWLWYRQKLRERAGH